MSLPQCVPDTKGGSRGGVRRMGRVTACQCSRDWNLSPGRTVNPKSWFTPHRFPFLSHLVSPVPPSPTVSEAAFQHQMSCWNLPSKSQSLPPGYSGCPESTHLHSRTPPQLCPGSHPCRACGFPPALCWLPHSVSSALLSNQLDVTSPDSSDPHSYSSYSSGLDLAVPGCPTALTRTPKDERRLRQAA